MPGSSCATWSQILMIWAAISSIVLVLYLLWMVELLPVTTWTFEVARCILWSRYYFLTQFFKMICHRHSQKCSFLVGGAWRCTKHLLWLAKSPNFNIIEPLVSFREQGEKQIPSIISQGTRRSVVQYSTRLFRTYVSLFQEGYKLCYRQMVAQLPVN